MRSPRAIPAHCRGCRMVSTSGIRDGKMNRWCCKFGRPITSTINHCRNVGGKESGDA